MKPLKIKIPNGYEVDRFDEKTGEIKFKETPKDVKERIKTIDDVLKDQGIIMCDIDAMFENVPEHLKWQYLAEILCKSLNEGWQPDWDDSSEYKYYPWFYMGGSLGFRYYGCADWDSFSDVGSRLCLKSSELAEYAGKQFTDLYQKFMITNN